MKRLGAFQEDILQAVRRLEPGAYSAAVQQLLCERGLARVNGGVWQTLRRLENRGFLASEWSSPQRVRGGRRRRLYRLQQAGTEALAQAEQARARWEK